jgi:hypothetical protein
VSTSSRGSKPRCCRTLESGRRQEALGMEDRSSALSASHTEMKAPSVAAGNSAVLRKLTNQAKSRKFALLRASGQSF